jgi:hypothetical protein
VVVPFLNVPPEISITFILLAVVIFVEPLNRVILCVAGVKSDTLPDASAYTTYDSLSNTNV